MYMISQLQRSPPALFGRAWATCRPENTLHMQWITPDLAVLLVSDPKRSVQPSGERLKVMTRGAAWVWFKEGMVTHRMAVLLLLCLVALPCCSWAQDESGGEDDPAITSSLGMPLSFPLNPTHQYAGLGLGVSAGVGYNLDRHNAFVGEFMWNWLFASDRALEPFRVALQSNNVSGHGNVFAFTANYRLELRGRTGGIYFIGGPGWIYRTASLSRAIPQGTPVPCNPIYLWWGYNCADGPVITNSTSVHSNAGAPGLNGGIGFTVRTGEAPYRAYVESRYYFAPTGSVSTKLLTLTVGIRY
jgi:hypothetical protein